MLARTGPAAGRRDTCTRLSRCFARFGAVLSRAAGRLLPAGPTARGATLGRGSVAARPAESGPTGRAVRWRRPRLAGASPRGGGAVELLGLRRGRAGDEAVDPGLELVGRRALPPRRRWPGRRPLPRRRVAAVAGRAPAGAGVARCAPDRSAEPSPFRLSPCRWPQARSVKSPRLLTSLPAAGRWPSYVWCGSV